MFIVGIFMFIIATMHLGQFPGFYHDFTRIHQMALIQLVAFWTDPPCDSHGLHTRHELLPHDSGIRRTRGRTRRCCRLPWEPCLLGPCLQGCIVRHAGDIRRCCWGALYLSACLFGVPPSLTRGDSSGPDLPMLDYLE